MNSSRPRIPTRRDERFKGYRDLSFTYEGQSREVRVRVPDVSIHGMFINTAEHYPEGAVLRIRFFLNRLNYEVQARGEVRYCLPGVGIGVEFVEIAEEAQNAIVEEFTAQAATSAAGKP